MNALLGAHVRTARVDRRDAAELARLLPARTPLKKSSRTSSALRLVCFLLLALLAGAALAQANDPTPLRFSDAAEEARFHRLTAELRCVMCQNQSLADSNAQIAHDLRREVLDLMRQGKSDAEVKRFLVDRYGEFVLYKPAVEPDTWILWFGPALLLIGGGLIVWRIVKKHGNRPVAEADEDQEW